MSVLLKSVITLTIFLFIFYGFTKAEEEVPDNKKFLYFLYVVFWLAFFADVALFLVWLWRF